MSNLESSRLKSTRPRWRRRIGAGIASLSVTLLCMGSIALPSQASTPALVALDSSYNNNYTGTSPNIYYPRMSFDGPSFSIPLSQAVVSGKITTFSAQLAFTMKPSGTNYVVYLCADAANTQCINVSPTGSWYGSSSWNVPSNAGFAGYPAYTTFHYVVRIDDGGSGSTIPPLSPMRYSLQQNTNLFYQ